MKKKINGFVDTNSGARIKKKNKKKKQQNARRIYKKKSKLNRYVKISAGMA